MPLAPDCTLEPFLRWPVAVARGNLVRCTHVRLAQDYELKFGLLDDVYTVLDMESRLGGAIETTVGGFDMVYNNGPVRPENSAMYSSRLGNFVDRERQLKQLHARHSIKRKAHKDLERVERTAERAERTTEQRAAAQRAAAAMDLI